MMPVPDAARARGAYEPGIGTAVECHHAAAACMIGARR